MVDIRRQGTTAERPQGPIPETGCRVPGDIRAAEVLATSPGHFLVSEVGGHCRHCQQERRASDMAVAPGTVCVLFQRKRRVIAGGTRVLCKLCTYLYIVKTCKRGKCPH